MSERRTPKARERVLVVIPARLNSTRLPRKLLLDRTGWPLLRHTWTQVTRATRPDGVLVATDSEEIVEAVRAFGGDAMMTAAAHKSGTDRVAEVARARPEFGVIVNVQGDEPEIDPAAVDLLVELMHEPDEPRITTLATWLGEGHADPNKVKVVCARNGDALYFSRAPIPYFRDQREGLAPPLRHTARRKRASRSPNPRVPEMPGPYLHVGTYAYRRRTLIRLAAMELSPLEQAERLEQLRALEAGLPIRVGLLRDHQPGIDTQADYDAFVERQKLEAAETRHE